MSKGTETRSTILDEALAAASRVGFESLSIGDLARRVGMSKSGLFAHFDSKEALQLQVLEAAVERFVERVVAPALTAPRGEPRIRAFFDRWLAWDDDPETGGCIFMQLAQELDARPGPVRDRLVASQEDWIGSLARAARIAIDEGHFRPDLDTRQFAYEMYSIALVHHHFKRLLRDPEAEARARRSFETLLAAARAGGAADSSPTAR
jgi:AcrR family transcriptional regulator